MAKKSAPIDALATRTKLGMNQKAFWSRVGVTQSGGSRLERGITQISKPLKHLLTIGYGTEAQAKALVKQLRGAAL